MRRTLPAVFAILALTAQAPPGPPKPTDVVATLGDRKLTAEEIQRIIRSMPPQFMSNYAGDPVAFLKQYFLLQKLSEDAAKNGLDKAHPYRGWLEYSRTSTLASARLHHVENSMNVSEDEFQKHLAANKEKYQRARTKVIYIAFASTPPPGSKVLTEPQARELVESIRKQAVAGADFGALAKKYSNDKASVEKNGDYRDIKNDPNDVPDVVRKPIFALKVGEITAPIRLPNGFYLFRLGAMITPPLDEIRQDASADIRQSKFKQWMANFDKSIDVKADSPAVLRDLAR